jgi:hypothetical protein
MCSNLNLSGRASTGEPDAVKVARPVRRGPDGKGAAMPPRRLATLLKKDGLDHSDRSFPSARNSMEGQGEPIHLAGWREEDSIRQDK